MWDLDHQEGSVPKNWCFWIIVLEKTLEHPLDYKEIKPANPKEINPEYSLEGLMLKLQYFVYLMWRADSLEKLWCWERLRAGGEGDDRGWGGSMASLTQWTWVWTNSGRWWWTGKSIRSQRVGNDLAPEQQQLFCHIGTESTNTVGNCITFVQS